MLNYDALIKYFDEYTDHYREVLDFEYRKLENVISNNVTWLSTAVSKEQAYIMKTNAFEARRAKLLGEEGAGMTFLRIIEEAPESCKQPLKDYYNEISQLVFEIKRVNNHAQEVINDRLHAAGSYEQSNTYSPRSIRSEAVSKNA